jgi:transcriptional regulator with GAF, ATPase, and Fis domain
MRAYDKAANSRDISVKEKAIDSTAYSPQFSADTGDHVSVAPPPDTTTNNTIRQLIPGLVGSSRAMSQLCQSIQIVATTTATVLIHGETGVGKEVVARALHQLSKRCAGPYIKVNCASIPKELFESEFFGHVRGAFTGAIKDRVGRFEAASGGTLFLDEIGEIPYELQSKLLRALQERQFERVGDERTRRADVRILAATNRDLGKEVKAGRFREDLFYRLNVFPVQVPPLRERREDIPTLAEFFVNTLSTELRCPQPRLTKAGVIRLQNYHWPGNVRELRNVIERATILAAGGALEFDLPLSQEATVHPGPKQEAANRAGGGPPETLETNVHASSKQEDADRAAGGASQLDLSREANGADSSSADFLTEPEIQLKIRENVRLVLQKTGWRIGGRDGAAELLGLKPTTLISRMKKLGLQRLAPSSGSIT